MQSYGSRYVRPPIIVGDISRAEVGRRLLYWWVGGWVGWVDECGFRLRLRALYGSDISRTEVGIRVGVVWVPA